MQRLLLVSKKTHEDTLVSKKTYEDTFVSNKQAEHILTLTAEEYNDLSSSHFVPAYPSRRS